MTSSAQPHPTIMPPDFLIKLPNKNTDEDFKKFYVTLQNMKAGETLNVEVPYCELLNMVIRKIIEEKHRIIDKRPVGKNVSLTFRKEPPVNPIA